MASRPELVRDLGPWHAAAIVVGTVIGSGIFLVPAEMMQAVGSSGMVYLAWIVGGVLSFAGALTYAELGAMKPEAGGEYAYIRDAYGPLAGFLNSWTWFAIAKPASIATVVSGVTRILQNFEALKFLPERVVASVPVTWEHVVASSVAIFISTLNYIGIRKAADFQLFFTILKVLMICGIGVVGFSYAGGSWSNFATHYEGAKGGVAGFMAALVAALWAYDGWNDLNQVAGEVRRPEKNLPFGLVMGTAALAGLYMLTNAALQYVLPAEVVANSPRPASEAVQRALGAWGGAALSAAIAVSMVVTLNGTVMSGARIPFAVARDGYFFQALATVHPRYHTPSTAIVVQAVIAIALLIVGGTFRDLFSLAIFSEWLIYMAAAGSIFVFRGRGIQSPYRMWGYPAVPAMFIAASAILLYYTFFENVRNSLIGCGVIAAGVPIFFFFKSKRQG